MSRNEVSRFQGTRKTQSYRRAEDIPAAGSLLSSNRPPTAIVPCSHPRNFKTTDVRIPNPETGISLVGGLVQLWNFQNIYSRFEGAENSRTTALDTCFLSSFSSPQFARRRQQDVSGMRRRGRHGSGNGRGSSRSRETGAPSRSLPIRELL